MVLGSFCHWAVNSNCNSMRRLSSCNEINGTDFCPLYSVRRLEFLCPQSRWWGRVCYLWFIHMLRVWPSEVSALCRSGFSPGIESGLQSCTLHPSRPCKWRTKLTSSALRLTKLAYLSRFLFLLGFWLLSVSYLLIRTPIHFIVLNIFLFNASKWRPEWGWVWPLSIRGAAVGNGSYFLTLFTILLSSRSGNFAVRKWSYLFLYNDNFLVLSKKSSLTLLHKYKNAFSCVLSV